MIRRRSSRCLIVHADDNAAADVVVACITSVLAADAVVACITSLLGDDGQIAGNPDVDIQLIDAAIDLAGLIIMEPTTLLLVRPPHSLSPPTLGPCP